MAWNGSLCVTSGFMSSCYDDHQTKNDSGEKAKIEKYSQKNFSVV